MLAAEYPSPFSEKENNSLTWAVDIIAKDAFVKPAQETRATVTKATHMVAAAKVDLSAKGKVENKAEGNATIKFNAKAGTSGRQPETSTKSVAEKKREKKREQFEVKRGKSSEDPKNISKRAKM